MHFTEQMKLIVQQRNLILDFFSIISFTGAEGIKFMLEKSMKLLGPLLRQWKWLVGSQISWESHCNHIEPCFLWWEDRSRGEREGKILFFFFFLTWLPFYHLGCYWCSEKEPKAEVKGKKKNIWAFESIGLVLIKAFNDILRVTDYFLLLRERCGSSIEKIGLSHLTEGRVQNLYEHEHNIQWKFSVMHSSDPQKD